MHIYRRSCHVVKILIQEKGGATIQFQSQGARTREHELPLLAGALYFKCKYARASVKRDEQALLRGVLPTHTHTHARVVQISTSPMFGFLALHGARVELNCRGAKSQSPGIDLPQRKGCMAATTPYLEPKWRQCKPVMIFQSSRRKQKGGIRVLPCAPALSLAIRAHKYSRRDSNPQSPP